VEPWLQPDELAADALQDLRTKQNRLSVYLVDSLESPALNRVLAAMAASRDNIDKLDYASFDWSFLGDLGIEVEAVPGGTPDEEVNQWHRDLVELTAAKLAALGLTMRRHGNVSRKYPKDVTDLIREGVRLSQIDYGRLKQTLASKIIVKGSVAE